MKISLAAQKNFCHCNYCHERRFDYLNKLIDKTGQNVRLRTQTRYGKRYPRALTKRFYLKRR